MGVGLDRYGSQWWSMTSEHARIALDQARLALSFGERCGVHLGAPGSCWMPHAYDEIFFPTALCIAAGRPDAIAPPLSTTFKTSPPSWLSPPPRQGRRVQPASQEPFDGAQASRTCVKFLEANTTCSTPTHSNWHGGGHPKDFKNEELTAASIEAIRDKCSTNMKRAPKVECPLFARKFNGRHLDMLMNVLKQVGVFG